MKITFISDTHGLHEQLKLEPTDLLIHAGDLSNRGLDHEVQQFLDWFEKQPASHKVFVGGNHDFMLEQKPALFREMLKGDYIYLEDEMVEIEGIKIWGSPITPFFFNWAFNRQRGADIKRYWDLIPDDIDILVTHGPPLGQGDLTAGGDRVGCVDLLDAVYRVKPKVHVFGHIHEARGVSNNRQTQFINASILNLQYRMVNNGITIEWNQINGNE